MSITFDPIRYTKRLEDVGVAHDQAGVHAEAMTEVLSYIDDKFANKEDLKKDLKDLETSTQFDIRQLESKIMVIIKESELRLTLRMGALMAGGVSLITALLVLLHIH